jgi:hypothetical protein
MQMKLKIRHMYTIVAELKALSKILNGFYILLLLTSFNHISTVKMKLTKCKTASEVTVSLLLMLSNDVLLV